MFQTTNQLLTVHLWDILDIPGICVIQCDKPCVCGSSHFCQADHAATNTLQRIQVPQATLRQQVAAHCTLQIAISIISLHIVKILFL